MRPPETRAKVLAGLVGCAAVALVAAPDRSVASSHREAPLITNDPQVDNTDVYAFVSPDRPETVTLVANFLPFQEPAGGPNFYRFNDNALYEIHIDNDGDAIEDITYQLQFETIIKNDQTFLYNTGPITFANGEYRNLNIAQRYTITRVEGDRRSGQRTELGTDLLVAPSNVGPKSIPDYPSLVPPAIVDLDDGSRVFCGQRDDPFFIALGRTFDLLNFDDALPGGLDTQCGTLEDNVAGFNVLSIVIQVPMERLTSTGQRPTAEDDPAAIIGVWSTASRPQVQLRRLRPRPTQGRQGAFFGGAFVQVSRLGQPLVNEVVLPLEDKDLFNNSEPSNDAQFLDEVQDPELATLLNQLFGIAVPNPPRQDLVQLYLLGLPGLNQKGQPAEYLRLNMAVPPTPLGQRSRLGFLGGDRDGFPNGRRLTDDVVDISLRAVAGALVDGFDTAPNNQLGDGVCQNDVPFLDTFPYLATPHDGVTHQHDDPATTGTTSAAGN